jgi:putative ABC transport system substrate-binding protein
MGQVHRRTFLLASSALLAAPLASLAQQARKIPRIGVLSLASPSSTTASIEAFRSSLRNLGYVEGRTIEVEYRSAEGRVERLPELAMQLVARNVDVILTDGGNASTLAARKATTTIPIVMSVSVNAVESGLIASLARPGGNITGLTVPRDLGAKQLELLRELVPSLSRVAVLTRSDPAAAVRRAQGKAMLLELLRLTIDYVEVREPEDLAQGFAAMRALRPNAMLVGPDTLFFHLRDQILEFARAARLPAMYPFGDFVDAGGLVSYSVSSKEVYRTAAHYIDNILKGAKPADLPVEEPREFELVINLKTAKSLGITIPQSILIRADRVIE